MVLTIKKILPALISYFLIISTSQAAVNQDQVNSATASPENNYSMVGPFQFTTAYSDVFGTVFKGRWTNYLTPDNAFGFEVNFGDDEFRLGGTLTHAITPSQRFKLTAEHFAQQFDFDFIGGQRVQWAGQNDFGGVYQYLFLQNNWLKNFSLGGYYTNAETETGNPAYFATPQGTFVNIRRFAGASNSLGFTGVSIQPWTMARIEANINYSKVHYDSIYEPAKNSSGIGGTLGFRQVLSDHFKLNALASHFAPYNQYQAGISYLFNTHPGTRLELTLAGSRINGDILNSADNRVMLGLAYRWQGDPCGPRASYKNDDPDNLIDWTTLPAVYMPAVLVQLDQKVHPH